MCWFCPKVLQALEVGGWAVPTTVCPKHGGGMTQPEGSGLVWEDQVLLRTSVCDTTAAPRLCFQLDGQGYSMTSAGLGLFAWLWGNF